MSVHVVPLRIYFVIFASLMILTAMTVAVAYYDLGPLNTIVALVDRSDESSFGHSLFHACPLQSQPHKTGCGGIVSLAVYHALNHDVGLRVARLVMI